MSGALTQEQTFAVKLMEHLVVPTFVLSADRRVLIWNRACERLTGLPAAEVVGTRDHWAAFYDAPRYCLADLIALGEMDALDQLYEQHSDKEKAIHCLQAENWCVMPRVGGRLYLAIDAGPIYDEEGRLIAVVETLRDHTEQKLAQTELENLAVKDGLTGLANRRALDERLAANWLYAVREKQPLSLVLVDVDHFKKFNDSRGHQAGDECLRQVAQAMEQEIKRPLDLAARYGGEEFVAILPGTDQGGAARVARRIAAAVEALGIPHPASDTAPNVTVSIGVASTVPAGGGSQAELIALADKMLYAAKAEGRNRVREASMAE